MLDVNAIIAACSYTLFPLYVSVAKTFKAQEVLLLFTDIVLHPTRLKILPPQAYLRISRLNSPQTCNMQIKRNNIKRRISPLLPVHNPIPPILNPICLPSV
jgi:hypothetical protein